MKTAFVTGSARGIGRATAIRLAKDGYRVIVHGAGNIEKAKETAKIIEENGGVAEVRMFDLCNVTEIKEFAQSLGNIDVLVLNASVQHNKHWEEVTAEDFTNHLNCNVVASLMLIQSVVPYMKQQGWGRIITIGSVQEIVTNPKMVHYGATKAAQTKIAHSMAMELAPYGITVNNIAPGVIYTDRNVEALSNPEYAKKVMDSIPAGFYGEPKDCVGIISLLCSDEGRYITGQSIFVDGGKGIQ